MGKTDSSGHQTVQGNDSELAADDNASRLEELLTLAQRGWHIFPCHSMAVGKCSCGKGAACESPGKHPRTSRGVKDATNDPDKIRAWVSAYPTANWAVACGEVSGVFVVDVDPRHGGFDALEQWTADHPLPETLTVLTGGGGRHFYFEYPADSLIGNRTNWITGVDVRGNGGYVILPPSNHQSGGTYRWRNDLTAVLAPPALIQSIAKSARDNSPASNAGDDLYARISVGARNDTVFRRACVLVRKLGDAPEAIEGVKAILRGLIDDPGSFPESELHTAVDSAVRTVRESGELPGGLPKLVRDRLEWLQANDEAQRIRKEQVAADARANLPAKRPMSHSEHMETAEALEHEWNIPKRIPRRSRMIWTADEGAGKSTFLRYMGSAAAIGIDPFDWANGELFEPQKVLLVDAENSFSLAMTRIEELRTRWEARVPGAGELIGRNLHYLDAEDFGLPLALEDSYDAERLHSWVEAGGYDVIVIGPIYQLSDESDHEAVFNAIVPVLDKLRAEFGCSILLEAHTPHDSAILRPYGSSAWKRWPEQGFHLSTRGRLTQWRGNRFGTDVEWPERIYRESDGQVMFTTVEPSPGDVAAVGGYDDALAETPSQERICSKLRAAEKEWMTAAEIADLFGTLSDIDARDKRVKSVRVLLGKLVDKERVERRDSGASVVYRVLTTVENG